MVGVSRSQRIHILETEMLHLRKTVLQLKEENKRMKHQQDLLFERFEHLSMDFSNQYTFQRKSAKNLETSLNNKIKYLQQSAKLLSQRYERQNGIHKKYFERKIEVFQQQNNKKILSIQREFQHRIKIAKQQYIEYSQSFYEGHIVGLKKSLNKKCEDLGHEQKYSSKASQKKNIQQIKLHKSLSSREIERK